MELNIPVSVQCDGVGEAVFNNLDGTSSALGPGPLLGGIPAGNGYWITSIDGNDGAPIRNPVTNRPHTHGAIAHMFKRSGTVVTVAGEFIVTAPHYRQLLADHLRSVLNGSLALDPMGGDGYFRFLWTPPGAATRVRRGKCYETLKIGGSDAAPKTFEFSMYFERPEANDYAVSVSHGGSTPNAGNMETFPIINVYAGGPFSLSNGTYEVKWGKSFLSSGPMDDASGTYIQVDMYAQTMIWDNGANALQRLFPVESDFWTIPPGGCNISCDAGIDVYTSAGWAG